MHFSEAARTNNENLPCLAPRRECHAIQITRAMKIVVFQLHVRGWVESIARALVMTSPKCRVVKVCSKK